MSDKPTILLVEDDDFAAKLTAQILSADYTLRHVNNGQEALREIEASRPDLVLLDVEMPELSGYEVCRILREDSANGDFPIIFLSGHVNDEDRLAGYEAGGDDYLTKPVFPSELRAKIKRALDGYAERCRLKEEASYSFSTAMTAMSNAAEIGTVLQFLRNSFNCPDYAGLSREVLNALSAYGFEGSVQIRGQQGVVSYGMDGLCSPLEESVLSKMAEQGRLFEFSTRISCSYEHITIIVKNVDRTDAERQGRFRDSVAMLAEGADARVVTLDSNAALATEHTALAKLIDSTRQMLREIDLQQHEQRRASSEIFDDLQNIVELRFLTLGLTASQEEELAEMLQNAKNRASVLYDKGLATEALMSNILLQLNNTSH